MSVGNYLTSAELRSMADMLEGLPMNNGTTISLGDIDLIDCNGEGLGKITWTSDSTSWVYAPW